MKTTKEERLWMETKGSVTIEMAYILPLFLTILMLVLYVTFYYHDKNILIGAAQETAVVGAQYERWRGEEVDLEQFFWERTQGKLVLFASPQVTVNAGTKEVKVSVLAVHGRWKMTMERKASVHCPETAIRRKRAIERMIGDDENRDQEGTGSDTPMAGDTETIQGDI